MYVNAYLHSKPVLEKCDQRKSPRPPNNTHDKNCRDLATTMSNQARFLCIMRPFYYSIQPNQRTGTRRESYLVTYGDTVTSSCTDYTWVFLDVRRSFSLGGRAFTFVFDRGVK